MHTKTNTVSFMLVHANPSRISSSDSIPYLAPERSLESLHMWRHGIKHQVCVKVRFRYELHKAVRAVIECLHSGRAAGLHRRVPRAYVVRQLVLHFPRIHVQTFEKQDEVVTRVSKVFAYIRVRASNVQSSSVMNATTFS